MNITISGLSNADKHLATGRFDALLSIGHPTAGQHCEGRVLHNCIVDTSDMTPNMPRTEPLPPIEAVIEVIEWARTISEEATVLIHCKHGNCRSTALAIIMLLAKGWNARDAVRRVYATRKRCTPNWYILAMGDHLLGTNALGHIRDRKLPLKSSRRDMQVPQ